MLRGGRGALRGLSLQTRDLCSGHAGAPATWSEAERQETWDSGL